MSGQQHIFDGLIPGNEWSPLDGVPAPEYVPPVWDGPHVGKRLVVGLRTLRLMPAVRGPRLSGNGWPSYYHDWVDQLAQQEADAQQKEQDRLAQNKTRVRPSSVDIAQMEIVICWPASYLAHSPQLITAVQVVALGRARHRDIHWAAERLSLPGRVMRRWNREGLDLIAAGLRRDRVPIF